MEAGGKTAAERATAIWQEVLKTYSAPTMDPSIGEALAAFVAKRREQGGAPID
jgi:trimethylamine---corrinoid protein Co-methyltransferase